MKAEKLENQSLIAEVGKYILYKNELKRERSCHRSKANYYKTLMESHGCSQCASHIRGNKKWNKPGKLGELRLLYKKALSKQIETEIKIHELVISKRKELADIKRTMKYHMQSDHTKITRLIVLCGGERVSAALSVKEIEEVVINADIEQIILGGV